MACLLWSANHGQRHRCWRRFVATTSNQWNGMRQAVAAGMPRYGSMPVLYGMSAMSVRRFAPRPSRPSQRWESAGAQVVIARNMVRARSGVRQTKEWIVVEWCTS